MQANASHDDDTGILEPLRFALATEPPALDDVQVFERESFDIGDVTFKFRIIGASHYISAPTIDYHEITSCRPVDVRARVKETFPLEETEQEETFTYEADGVTAQITADVSPLSAFPVEKSHDLAYRFDPMAYTTIDLVENGYETYHTYPEIDIAVYTRTTFDRLSE